MKLIRLSFIALASTFVMSPAHAYVMCSGEPTYLSVSNTGTVWINFGHGVWNVCSTTTTLSAGGYSVAPDVCRTWYATFLAAQKSGGTIRFYFANPSPACNAIGSWVIPNPLPYQVDSY